MITALAIGALIWILLFLGFGPIVLGVFIAGCLLLIVAALIPSRAVRSGRKRFEVPAGHKQVGLRQ